MPWRHAFRGLLALTTLLYVAPLQAQTRQPLTPAAIDAMFRAAWKKEKITPAPPVDDARFLRRIYLDIVGRIPPPEAIREFLADKSPDKRAKAVERLLNSPRYAEHWTNYWDSVLMGRQTRPNAVVDRQAFRLWLRSRFETNTPWNRFVYDLLTATGVNSTGGSFARGAGLMTREEQRENEEAAASGKVNGAVNWLLKYLQNPADLSGNASRIFLGVQIQCAQCHDHKTEKWTQEDFRRFTACFSQLRPFPVSGMMQPGRMRILEIRDVPRPVFPGRRAQGLGEYARATPAALDGTDFSSSPNRRQALAAWMTAPENPWFAEAIVNRMWAYFLGRGFVDPIDDFRPTNPPEMPELLKRLADDFVAHDYDLKHLIRTICATQVYQLSSFAPKQKGDGDIRLWSRFRLKPLGPEVLVDSLVQATNMEPILERVAGGNADRVKAALARQFVFLFDVDEEFEQKEFEGTIPQALLLLNGNLLNRGVTPFPGTALAQILAMEGEDAPKIEALYLRTVSRKPTATELKRWVAYVNELRDVALSSGSDTTGGRGDRPGRSARRAGADPLARLNPRRSPAMPEQTPKTQAYEDLFWALLNSSEFMFNH